MRGLSGGNSAIPTPLRPWRVTIAVRVFALAVATGLALGGTAPDERRWGPLLVLSIIAATSSLLEWGRLSTTTTRGVTVTEAVLAALVISSAPEVPGVLTYIAVPAIAAGVRHGWVTTVNTASVGVLVALGAMWGPFDTATASTVAGLLLWWAVGTGVGLLASWQSRSMRIVEARQAPLTAAHALMVQLHRLARRGDVGLDTTLLAQELCDEIVEVTGVSDCVVVALSASGVETLLAHRGTDPGLTRDADVGGVIDSITLQAAGELLGFVRVTRQRPWQPGVWERAIEVADDFALRLGTSLLFDGVRRIAADEERNRIARDMHDGVAQEIVALGYTVDEIEASSNEPEVRELAVTLRGEITRLVSELRLSIFNLRQHQTGRRLAHRLTDDVQSLTAPLDLRVHLELDETGPPLPTKVEDELARIAQEAIRNVTKHANAQNLWITYGTDGHQVLLEVKDDGCGSAGPRSGHFGLHMMRERAASIGASLDVTENSPRGTLVSLRIGAPRSQEERHAHEHDSPAR